MKKDVYQLVTDKIIEKLEAGIVPWIKPWGTGKFIKPVNYQTRHNYHGINNILLWMSGYNQPYWLGFKQCEQMGGKIRKGEKGTFIVYYSVWKKNIRDEKTGEMKEKNIPFLKYHYVWNIEQTEGIDYTPADDGDKLDFIPIEKADNIITYMQNRPVIHHGGMRAYYSPSQDYVQLPHKHSFKSVDSYYATAFHELTHSTMHKDRLNRDEGHGNHFGDNKYSKEELVAEIGSCFLCAESAIEKTFDNQVNYIGGWLQVLKNNNKLILQAASKANKAVDYILNRINNDNI